MFFCKKKLSICLKYQIRACKDEKWNELGYVLHNHLHMRIRSLLYAENLRNPIGLDTDVWLRHTAVGVGRKAKGVFCAKSP